MTALQAAIALVRDGKTIAQAADELDQPRGEVLQAVMTDYRGLVAARARSNGDARSLDYWLHHPSKKVATAAEKLRDVHDREDERARLLTQKKELEDKLAAIKAQLTGKPAAGRVNRELPCPHCERVLPNAQGLALHVKAKHKDPT